MKKIKYLVALLLLTTFISCKKETNSPEDPKLSSNDPVALSKAIKIWHGTRVQGTPPAPNGGPQISAPGEVQAFAGRYAVIRPELIGGNEVTGFIVALNGANEYFRVDYNSPRLTERGTTAEGRSRSILANGRKNTGRPGGVSSGLDSGIVVVLPTNLQVPDTFCVTYCPLDSLGNIGNPVTTCIIVNSLGGDANSAWITGNWRLAAEMDTSNVWEYYTYGTMTPSYQYYYCGAPPAGSNAIVPYFQQVPIGSDVYGYIVNAFLGRDSVKKIKDDIIFAANGVQNYAYESLYRYPTDVLWGSGGCPAALTYGSSLEEELDTGGWSLQGNLLTLIFEYDDLSGVPQYDAWQYSIQRINNTEFDLWDPLDPNYKTKLRKQ